MEHSAILLTCIKLPHGFNDSVLSNFEWPLKTSFTIPLDELRDVLTQKRPMFSVMVTPIYYCYNSIKNLVHNAFEL